MATVRDMLDRYHTGGCTLDALAADFRTRRWPAKAPATDAQAHGVHDVEHPDPNSWGTVDADSRLTPDVYQALAQAHATATGAA